MNAYYRSDWTALSLEPQPGGMKPVGVFLDEQLGEEVYTIGFTAFEGSQRQQGGTGELPVNAAPDGSLEHDLHALGETAPVCRFPPPRRAPGSLAAAAESHGHPRLQVRGTS